MAIDELGERTKLKKWMYLVPLFVQDKTKKEIIWRDGMGSHILGLFREEAFKRLMSIPKKFLYHANVNSDLNVAAVGHNIKARETITELEGHRDRLHEDTDRKFGDLDGHIDNSKTLVDNLDGNNYLQPINNDQDIDGISELPESRKERPKTGFLSTDKPPYFSAILYLGSPDFRNSWEFNSILVEKQSSQAILINLRRLFPIEAEQFFTLRAQSGNALAIRSSETTGGMLRHLLKLAFYIEDDETANMTLVELEEYNTRKNEDSRKARHRDSESSSVTEGWELR